MGYLPTRNPNLRIFLGFLWIGLDPSEDDRWYDSIDYDFDLSQINRFDDYENNLHRHIANINASSSQDESVDLCVLYHTNAHIQLLDHISLPSDKTTSFGNDLHYFDDKSYTENLPDLSSFSYSIFNGFT